MILWKVVNESLRQQLSKTADQCEKLLRDAMAQDADVRPGVECVAKLYEAYEGAKYVPAAPTGHPAPGSTPARVEDVGSTSATIIWIVAGGVALAGIASAIAG